MMDQTIRARKNREARMRGFSGCLRCGDTWDWKPRHDTDYCLGSGCFPLCQECWESLTVADRIPFYEQLIREWEAQTPAAGMADLQHKAALVIQAAKEGK